MENPEIVWPEVEEVERTKIDDWFNDFQSPPLSVRDNLILGLVLIQKPVKISYMKE